MILDPKTTCAVCTTAPRAGLLIDGRDYYRAVYDLCSQAKRSILMLGWQFDTRTALLRGDDAREARYPVKLLAFLRALCDERPELRVYLLAWEASVLFALEREPFQRLSFAINSRENLRFELDDCHPVAASQHQKLLVVDRSIAVLGGMDVCSDRWDDRAHLAGDERRRRLFPGWGTYLPYHDVQAYVTGDAVDTLRGWFAERWELGVGEELELGDDPREELELRPSVEIDAPRVGLARTLPPLDEPPRSFVGELQALHLEAIARAERLIYIENQYFTSEAIRRALIERMRRAGGERLSIAIVLPKESAGLKEQVTIGVRQAEILRQLERVEAETGHQVGVYYTTAPDGDGGEVPVFIHAKVLAVDDRFLLVSSANTTNRSMGLDSELGVAWEADQPTESLRRARVELMREHCGLEGDEAREMLDDPTGLVERLDRLAGARTHRLRRHPMREGEEPGETIAEALQAAEVPLDPGEPVFEEILPEPSGWFSGRWRQRIRFGLVRLRRLISRDVARAVFRQRHPGRS
jgi:phosphatidylserine/phosphatidylglycerophosphate/cardiolipin synthase-like enzyme